MMAITEVPLELRGVNPDSSSIKVFFLTLSNGILCDVCGGDVHFRGHHFILASSVLHLGVFPCGSINLARVFSRPQLLVVHFLSGKQWISSH